MPRRSRVASPAAPPETPPPTDAPRRWERPDYWEGVSWKKGWLKLPEELLLCPHRVDPRLRARHVWLAMRLIAQPVKDHVSKGKIRATWSQLRNAVGRQSATPPDRKLRALKGDPSYDAIRKWAKEMKGFGLLAWKAGGRRGDQEVASVFDLSLLAAKVEQIRQARLQEREKRRVAPK